MANYLKNSFKTIFRFTRPIRLNQPALKLSRTLTNSREQPSTKKQTTNDEPIKMNNPYEKEPRQCILCQLDITPNYKNVRLLSQFQSSYTGRIYGRHITGLCKRKQMIVEKEIIKAQNLALMGTYNKSLEFLKDPTLFDPDKPIRPHKY